MRCGAVLLLPAFAMACNDGGVPNTTTPNAEASESDAGPIAIGKLFVERRGCPSCHNPTDPADGVFSGRTEPLMGTKVYPRNLTPDPETGIGTWSDDDIAHAVRDGFAPGLEELCRQMSRFDRMSDTEVLAIIAYLRSLPPVRRAIPRSVCPPIKAGP